MLAHCESCCYSASPVCDHTVAGLTLCCCRAHAVAGTRADADILSCSCRAHTITGITLSQSSQCCAVAGPRADADESAVVLSGAQWEADAIPLAIAAVGVLGVAGVAACVAAGATGRGFGEGCCRGVGKRAAISVAAGGPENVAVWQVIHKLCLSMW